MTVLLSERILQRFKMPSNGFPKKDLKELWHYDLMMITLGLDQMLEFATPWLDVRNLTNTYFLGSEASSIM
jgi:hypothetical protein